MELFESKFKKFMNMAKVMKLIGEGTEELEMNDNTITFEKAKQLSLLPIGKGTSDRVRDRYIRFFTVTKPNEEGWSKVIYWVSKEDAAKVGDDFVLDDDIDPSLYS